MRTRQPPSGQAARAVWIAHHPAKKHGPDLYASAQHGDRYLSYEQMSRRRGSAEQGLHRLARWTADLKSARASTRRKTWMSQRSYQNSIFL